MKDHPTQIFGLPYGLSREDQQKLLADLRSAWVAMTGRPAAGLQEDWDWLFATWFTPTISGEKLRTQISELPAVTSEVDFVAADPLVIALADRKRLVTPEGRAAMDQLASVLAQQDGAAPEPIAAGTVGELLERYRRVGRHRLDDVVRHLAGKAGRMHPLTAGTLLFLLINRATSPDRAIARPTDEAGRRHLDEAMTRPVSAFADAIKPGVRNARHISLYSGWMLSELRRRLGARLPRTDEVALAPGSEDFAVQFLARDLAKAKLPADTVASAFDALVQGYREVAPALAEHGLDRERPAETSRMRQKLLAAYRRECPDC